MKRFALVGLLLIVAVPLCAGAEVNISVSIPSPPPLVFAGPPDVVVVPSESADVYLVPGMVGLYFYGGSWYRFYDGYWFQATLYSGPWVGIGAALVPPPVVVIPPDYILGVPVGYRRIHYDEFHSHWQEWGHSRHWHNEPWYRDHAAYHWGGREFFKPVVGHHRDVRGDVHTKSAVRRSSRGPGGKPGVHGSSKPRVTRQGVKHGSAVSKVGAQKGPMGAGHPCTGSVGRGGVSRGGNVGYVGGPAGAGHSGAGHAGHPEGHK